MPRVVSSVLLNAIVGCLLLVGGACAQPTLTDLKQTFRRPTLPAVTPDQSAAADVGRALFFDTGLSMTGAMSCGTCHQATAAWKDGRARPLDNQGIAMPRRAPTLLDLAWAPALTWDGRWDDLEAQATDPIVSPRMGALETGAIIARVAHLLRHDAALAARYRAAFATNEVTLTTVSRALATFERSLVSPMAPFDQWVEGDSEAISPAAQRGFGLFNGRGNCATCHGGWRFTDDGFHDIGLADADLGRGAKVPGEPTLQHAFKTPTLRGVAVAGPFMHDGSIASLSVVLDHYDGRFVHRDSLDPEIHALELSDGDRADLIAFLQSLSPPTARPDGPSP